MHERGGFNHGDTEARSYEFSKRNRTLETQPTMNHPDEPRTIERLRAKPLCHLLGDKRGWVFAAVGGAFRWACGGVLAVLLVGVNLDAAVPVTAVPVEDVWSVKVPEFRADAALEGAPTVLYFTATWCGYCRQMERTTLSNASVRTRLEPFGRVKLDYDQQPELVARYRIRGVPAFVMVNARGEELAQLTGMTEPDPFRGWLEEGKARGVELAKATVQRQAELKTLSEQLTGGGEMDPAEGWEKAKTRIFELAARGEGESREFALKQLTTRAGFKPSTLFEGLLHPDLAVRLAVTGVLKKTLGDRFVFDPWAEASVRKAAVREERFAMLADMSVGVQVRTWFVEFKRPLKAEGALAFLGQAGGQASGTVVAQLSVEQAAAVFAALKTMPRANVMEAPTVGVGAGNPARIAIGQEMRYPTRWEKTPEPPGWRPADFETRTVGTTMTVTPQVLSDGVVELTLSPNVTVLEGFVDLDPSTDAEKNGQGVAGAATLDGKPTGPKPPFTPVFLVHEAKATARVPAGQTVVLRGGRGKRVSWSLAGGEPAEVPVEADAVTFVFVTVAVKPPAGAKAAR